MTNYSQTKNEKRRYIQNYTGDTISSAVWTLTRIAGAGGSGTLSGQSDTTASTSILVSALDKGCTYMLSVVAQGASGQIYECDPPAIIRCDG